MLEVIRADLHVHSCLSPCASLDMTPTKIVREARKKGLALIAITDHNSAENAAAIQAAAKLRDPELGGYHEGPAVIAGMEVTTAEEAHVVALFETVEQALEMQELVFRFLSPGQNDEALFGMQVVANVRDEVERLNKRFLIGSTSLAVEEVVQAIHRIGGLAVAAHADRESFSIPGQLGFIPPGLDLDAIEISRRISREKGKTKFGKPGGPPVITASDAHHLEDLGSSPTHLLVECGEDGLRENPWLELSRALAGHEGRKVVEHPGPESGGGGG